MCQSGARSTISGSRPSAGAPPADIWAGDAATGQLCAAIVYSKSGMFGSYFFSFSHNRIQPLRWPPFREPLPDLQRRGVQW